jgi:hypothetical protein
MIKQFALMAALTFSSFAALADFDVAGNGTLKYPTGMNKPFKFGFAFTQGENGYVFKLGKQEMQTADVPTKYTIWLTLHGNDSVFVQEFAKGYFQEFEWKLDKHTIKLKKKIYEDRRVKGDYVLTINGDEFYFAKKSGQLNIYFNKKGVSRVDTDGFVRDRSFSKH